MATTLEMLIEAVKRGRPPALPDPAPSMPLGVAPPPVTTMPPGAPPDMAPTAPLPRADTGFINRYAGAAPVAPTLKEPGALDKIAAVLSGIAGGPGYGLALREERQRPIREYERQLEQFNQRRTQGLEIDERRREREQDRATRAAERKADRDFEIWADRARITNQEARDRAREAFDIQKIREQERIADERQERQLRAAQEKQRREIENKLASEDGAPPNIAKEISEYQVGLRPELSTTAQKWRSLRAQKLAAQLARVGGGGGSATPKNEVEIVNEQGDVVDRLPYTAIQFDQNGAIKGYPGATLRSSRAQQPTMRPAPGGVGPPTPITETLAGGIRMTTPATAPKLNKQQQARFRDIKREIPGATDDQVLDYMQRKGWLQ